ncbi:MAG: hypothetical protein HKM93_02840 [Desulfobacteraceae bacterium]|nr:hypothetical protein [Desulfobacteraceae bacterium]
MKKMFFVSTGRCGTKRMYEILTNTLPNNFSVVHQMKYSRMANIIGNYSLYNHHFKLVIELFFHKILKNYDTKDFFISTDPLTSHIIPKNFILDRNVSIIHIKRDCEQFAHSMYSLSRSRGRSYIAHNLIPLWQPGLWPLENTLNPKIIEKYKKIHRLKNELFEKKYKFNSNYLQIEMENFFSSNILQKLIFDHFGYSIKIAPAALKIKSNESTH